MALTFPVVARGRPSKTPVPDATLLSAEKNAGERPLADAELEAGDQASGGKK